MSVEEIIGRLISMIGKRVSFEDINPIVDSLSLFIEEEHWTPCSKGLPKTAGEYLVSYHPCCWDRVGSVIKVGFDTFRGKSSWAKNKYQKVIAWRHKPEPYCGERNDD